MLLPALLVELALSLSSASTTTVAIAPVDAVGFAATEVPAVGRSVEQAVVGAGLVAVPGPGVADDCAAAPACVQSLVLASGQDHLLRVTVLRVGADVEASDGLYDRSGVAIARGARVVPVDEFMKAPLSQDVAAALRDLAAAVEPAPEVRPIPQPRTPSKGMVTAVVGGLVGAAGVVGFALEASTLQDPTSLGTDKERARVTGWVYLGIAVVGVATAAAGVAWAVVDPLPIGAVPLSPSPSTPSSSSTSSSSSTPEPAAPATDGSPPQAR